MDKREGVEAVVYLPSTCDHSYTELLPTSPSRQKCLAT